MRFMRDAKLGTTCRVDTSQQGYPTGDEMPKIVNEKEGNHMSVHYDYIRRGQSSAISKEDDGCRNGGHRLT